MEIVKKVAAILLVVVMIVTPLNVNAEGGFDASYYASKYPDVVSVLGTDSESLRIHYLTYGITEGRFMNKWEEDNNTVNSLNITPISIIPGYNTYIDVDIDKQVVTYFEDGAIVFQSPCVTGAVNSGHGTPTGKFNIINKIPGKRLKGPTWDCWVNRWMKFTNTNCGFHDAKWRKSFGSDIYLTNGSHGCVNMPYNKVCELYDMVKVGTTVIVH